MYENGTRPARSRKELASFRVRVRKKAPTAAALAAIPWSPLGHKEKVNHLSREPPPPPSPTQINRPG